MIPSSKSNSNTLRNYSMLYYWDDAADTGTGSVDDPALSTTATTYLRPITDPGQKEQKEFLITTKELNRMEAQKILGRRKINIPQLDFKPKKIRKNNRIMFCDR